MKELYPFRGLPPAQGLYRPEHEHDACGIGFVANIEGTQVARHRSEGRADSDQSRPSRRLRLRSADRRRRGHPDPDSARLFRARSGERWASRCRRRANTAWAWCFFRSIRMSGCCAKACWKRLSREEGLTVLGWRDTPINGNTIGRLARDFAALHRADFYPQGGPGMDQDALERKLYVVRKRVESGGRRNRPEGEGFLLHSVAFVAHDRLQGLAARAADHGFLQGAARSRADQRAVPGAPALFDQHVSELEAGAPVPLHLPQRRNQHAARQYELDVRAAIRAGVSACLATTSRSCCPSSRRAAATPPCSTMPWSC